jgi:chromosome segregation ATPase
MPSRSNVYPRCVKTINSKTFYYNYNGKRIPKSRSRLRSDIECFPSKALQALLLMEQKNALIKSLNDTIKELNDIIALKTQSELALSTNEQALRLQITQKDELINKLQAEVNALKESDRGSKEQISNLENRIKKLTKDKNVLISQARNYKTNVRLLREDLDSRVTRVSELEKRLETVEKLSNSYEIKNK